MMQTGDSPSIVKNSTGDFVVDGGAYLPYDISATNNNSQLLASMQIGDTFGSHTCVLLVNGKVKCVGRNNYGQLGDGTTTLSMAPVEVIGITDATYVDGGDTTNCAILSDKTVKCWGRGDGGQLGNGGSTNSSTPVQVSGLTNVEKLSVGRDFSCVILTNGDVKCWGANDMGRLANGTISTNSLIYNDVPGITNAISISAGDDHVCSVLSNGTVYCWGANWSGQLGDGTNNQSSVPVSVSGISNATSVFVVSDESSCAVLSDKTVKCWGANWSGQLGNGTTTNSNIPVSVTGLANVEKITGGYGNFSTILTDGTVKSWGINFFGQLGDGTNVDKTTPVSIPGLSNVVNIAGGWGHVCALLNGGVVKCWGINDSGQFGDGTATSSYTPVDMQGL
ncbi:MAG: hypothetical protein PHH98_02640 [Candidatus Gracilibacteria bacterium]|nr:hypothetical protein [Candidatus Gracilibacteria bacterium]